MEKKVGLFTIGQFADIHGINKKTLMWYDEIGLFKPAVVHENGYRYYSHFQSSTLEAILMLRRLDVPIQKIQDFLANRSAESLKTLLLEQTADLKQQIAQLNAIQKTLRSQIQEIDEWGQIVFHEYQIVEKEQEYLILLHTAKNVAWEQDVKTLVDEVRRRQLGNLYDASYGAMMPVSSLYAGDLNDYRAVFLTVQSPKQKNGLHPKLAGRYLQVYHRGDIDHMADAYQQILDYAKKKNLSLCGYAYETVLNEITVRSSDEYITRIEIQLKP